MTAFKKTIIAFSLLLSLITVSVLSSCSGISNSDAELEVCKGLLIDSLPPFSIAESTKVTQSDGSVETYLVLTFSDSYASQLDDITSSWNHTPVLTTYSNFYNYVNVLPGTTINDARKKLTSLDEDNNVKYIFVDKTEDFKRKYETQIKERLSAYGKKENSSGSDTSGFYLEEADPRTPDYAVGFCCGFYSPDEMTMYFYQYDPAYSEQNVIYAANS